MLMAMSEMLEMLEMLAPCLKMRSTCWHCARWGRCELRGAVRERRARGARGAYFALKRGVRMSGPRLRTVLRPLVLRPHGVVGWWPPLLLPSPPPMG